MKKVKIKLNSGQIGITFGFISIAIVAIVASIIWSKYTDIFTGGFSNDQGHWGAFGDLFGGLLNPIVATLALVGLALTMWFQANTNELLKRESNERRESLAEEENRLITKEFVDYFFSNEFLTTRSAVYGIKERVLRNEISVNFIARGYVYPIEKNRPYFIGDIISGNTEHGFLTLYLGYLERLGNSLKNNKVYIDTLKESIGYGLRWDADLMRSVASASRSIHNTESQQGGEPSFIQPVFDVFEKLGIAEAADQIGLKHYDTPTEELLKNHPSAKDPIYSSAEKRDLTIKLHEQWVTSLRKSRTIVWDLFENKYPEALEDNSKISIKVRTLYSEVGTDIRDHITDVFQFFSDLKKLLVDGHIDKRLASRLFQHSLTPWFRFTDLIVYEVKEGEPKYYREVREWYQENVKGLKSSFLNLENLN